MLITIIVLDILRQKLFFSFSNLFTQDIFRFILQYRDGASLRQCSATSGLSYQTTACVGGKEIRDTVISKWLLDHLENVAQHDQLSGIVEIDSPVDLSFARTESIAFSITNSIRKLSKIQFFRC